VRAFAWGLLESGPREVGTSVVPLRIDLNRAGVGELAALPGIGPERAKLVLLHRVRAGPFATVDELLEVDGIGPETVAALREHATAGPISPR